MTSSHQDRAQQSAVTAELEVVHVAVVTDKNYIQHTGVAMYSVQKNFASKNHRLQFHVIGRPLTIVQCIKEYQFLTKFPNVSVIYHEVGEVSKYEALPLGLHFKPENYFRFELPAILGSIDRCIYLDGDLVVEGNLVDLWGVPLGANLLAAAEEPFGCIVNTGRLGIPKGYTYCNTGVLVMNLERMREESAVRKLLTWASENPHLIKYVDQDVLNAVLYDRIHYLPCEWNVTYLYLGDKPPVFSVYTNADVERAKIEPKIVHFAGEKTKPWNYLDTQPLRSHYWKYLSATPWRGYSPPDRTLMNVFSKQKNKLVLRSLSVLKMARGIVLRLLLGRSFLHRHIAEIERSEEKRALESLRVAGVGARIRYPWNALVGLGAIEIGAGSIVEKGAFLGTYGSAKTETKIKLGEGVFVNFDSQITAIEYVELGDGVVLGSRVLVTDHAHGEFTPNSISLPPLERPLVSKGPTIIGSNVWIGSGAAILSGVTIGEGCVVGANSVVTRSFPPRTMIAGNPARRIKSL